MSKIRISLVMFVAITLVMASGCAKKQVDLVRGVPSVSNSLASISGTVDAMSTMSPSERGAYLERTWPNLQRSLAFYLRQHGKLDQTTYIENIEFRYGSLEDIWAESGDGDKRYGFIRDQLVALVYLVGSEEPIAVIVECLNGTFALPEDLKRLQYVGNHHVQEQFTIGPGEGLIHHVDFPVAIDLADRFGLQLYRGRDMNARARITPAEARRLESTTDRLQVTVYVVEGDFFDLRNNIFRASSRRGKRDRDRLSS